MIKVVFKLSFEQFMILVKRIDSTEGASPEPIFPLFYYIGRYAYLYKLYGGYVFCSVVSPENSEEFKNRYLTNAYALTENYLDYAEPIITDIPTENPNE